MTRKRVSARQPSRVGDAAFQLLFPSHPVPAWVHDSETLAFLDVNDAALRQYGFSRDEFLSMTITALLPPPALARAAGAGKDPAATGPRRHLVKDGRVVDVTIITAPLIFQRRPATLVYADPSSQGRPAAEQTPADAAPRASEIRYRRLVDSNIIGVIVANTDGRVIEANDRFLGMLGYTRADVEAGRVRWDTITPPEWRAVDEHILQQLQAVGACAPCEKECLHRDGHRVPILAAVALLDGIGGDCICLIDDLTQRRQAQEAARESEKRLRSLIDGLGPSMFVGLLTPDGTLIEVNQAALTATGLTREDMLGRPCADIYPFTYSRDVQQQLNEAIDRSARGEASRYDMEIRTADDQPIIIDFSLQPLRGESGRVEFLVPSAVVITERKQAEDALREREHRLSEAQRVAQLGSWTIELPSFRLIWSEEMYRIYGVSPETFVPSIESALGCLHPDDRPLMQEWIRACVANEKPGDLEVRAIHPDANTRTVLGRGESVQDEANRPIRVIGTVQDITERKRAEVEKIRLHRVLEAILNEIYIFDNTTLRFEYANDCAQRNLGYSMDALRALTPLDLKPEFSEAGFNQLIGPLRRHEQPKLQFETVHRRADGSLYPVEVHLQLIERDGESVFLAVINDITERRVAETAIEQANLRLQTLSRRLLDIQETERRQIARELHDDIGQALSAAKINLQSLQRDPDPGDMASRLQDTIAIVEDTLERVRSLSVEMRPTLLDDLGLAAALRWLADREASRANLGLEFHCTAPDTRLDTSVETACFRVAQEALANIVKHAGARNIVVDLQAQGGRLHLRVSDDGAGFDVAAAHRRAARGASLGLLGMEERAALAGGGIEWSSTSGQGTEVRAWFALRRVAGIHPDSAAIA